jgi:ribosome-binding protein aMBF1 (putative translation factor)
MMNSDTQYKEAIEQAKSNLADLRERGDAAIGESWDDVRKELFTPEEIAASDLRVAMMIKIAHARKERGISQKKLEELSGVKQPIIARMERGSTSPQVDTVLKVLAPLGMTLAVVPLHGEEP